MNEFGKSKGSREAVKDKSWGSTLQLFLGSRCQDRQKGCGSIDGCCGCGCVGV